MILVWFRMVHNVMFAVNDELQKKKQKKKKSKFEKTQLAFLILLKFVCLFVFCIWKETRQEDSTRRQNKAEKELKKERTRESPNQVFCYVTVACCCGGVLCVVCCFCCCVIYFMILCDGVSRH